MLSSGTSPQSTNGNARITLVANPDKFALREFNFVNTGTVAGFVSVDGGVTPLYMPAGTANAPACRNVVLRSAITAVLTAQRITDGSDMTGLYADAY